MLARHVSASMFPGLPGSVVDYPPLQGGPPLRRSLPSGAERRSKNKKFSPGLGGEASDPWKSSDLSVALPRARGAAGRAIRALGLRKGCRDEVGLHRAVAVRRRGATSSGPDDPVKGASLASLRAPDEPMSRGALHTAASA